MQESSLGLNLINKNSLNFNFFFLNIINYNACQWWITTLCNCTFISANSNRSWRWKCCRIKARSTYSQTQATSSASLRTRQTSHSEIIGKWREAIWIALIRYLNQNRVCARCILTQIANDFSWSQWLNWARRLSNQNISISFSLFY